MAGRKWPDWQVEYLQRKGRELTQEDLEQLAGLFDRSVLAIRRKLWQIARERRLSDLAEVSSASPRPGPATVTACAVDRNEFRSTEHVLGELEICRRFPALRYLREAIGQQMGRWLSLLAAARLVCGSNVSEGREAA